MPSLVATLLAEPPLDAAEERRLALAAAAGDASARATLVRRSLRLVALRVRSLGAGGADVDDAFQCGALGLLAAVARYDPDRGARLATFAWPWITAGVRAGLARSSDEPVEDVPEPPARAPDGTPERVALLLRGLDPLDRRALELRHGIGPGEGVGRTWRDVGLALGTSPATARRIGERAMSRLRAGVGTVGDRAPPVGAGPP